MRNKYSIGLDFGTLAARAVIIDVETGQELATSTFAYQDTVIDTVLPETNVKLPEDFALANPRDYKDAVVILLRDVLCQSGICANEVVGIGVDATASTVLALDVDYNPLCLDPRFKSDPHSWMKMWKHHSPQKQADRINELANAHDEAFLRRCGGKVSAEWYYPKMLETLEQSPEVFYAAEYFVELGDWIVYLLTGEKKRSTAIASLHAHWSQDEGLPSECFFEDLDPRLHEAVKKNAQIPVVPVFSRAGTLTKEIADQTGLLEGTAVSMADTDSPVALFSLGVTDEKTAALILGTSSVFMFLSKEEHYIPGAMASVKDQMMPGFYGNMFGQSAVGDVYDWFVKNALPYQYYLEAQQRDEAIFDVINGYVEKIDPAQISVYALDWLNGSRSLLQDANLSGAFFGITLATKPEHIYFALLESTAFEFRTIFDAVLNEGIKIDAIRACGGIARKSPVIMQMFADILNTPIYTVASKQTVGRGAAILGAVAAGKEAGGYETLQEAIEAMQCAVDRSYSPREEYVKVYERRYKRYMDLYRYFGMDHSEIMSAMKMRI